MRKSSGKSAVLPWVLALALSLAAAELAAWGALGVVQARAPYLFYRAPVTDPAAYANYLAWQHPQLGWMPIWPGEADASLSRKVPAFPEPGNECASLYGDSFTYGVGVEPEETWANRLSETLGCRVANFGGHGFGVDQAVLRFLGEAAVRPKVVVLAIWPEDILRSLNRWQYLITIGGEFSFKPRFVLEGGELRLLPTPRFEWDRYQACARRPEDCLDHETFLPDSAEGPVRPGFPYLVTAWRVASSPRVVNYLAGRVSWAGFLDEGHPAGARPLMRALIGRFAAEARARGSIPLVVVFPTVGSQRLYQQGRGVATRPLLDDLDALRIAHADLHEPLASRLAGRSICDILDGRDQCGGHFNAEGNRLVADSLAPMLRDMLAGPDYPRRP